MNIKKLKKNYLVFVEYGVIKIYFIIKISMMMKEVMKTLKKKNMIVKIVQMK